MGERPLSLTGDRGREFWSPTPIWRGETVFILGGGPSLTQDAIDSVRGRGRAIAVNSSASKARWADMLLFTDNSWFEPRQAFVASWSGMAVTLSRHAKVALPDKLLRLREMVRRDFPPDGADHIRHGRSSGQRALSLAVSLRAALVVLLGFDMRVGPGGREHHHDEYAGETRDLGIYESQFRPAFAGWHRTALMAGTRVVNASAGSALTEFPFIDLADLFA